MIASILLAAVLWGTAGYPVQLVVPDTCPVFAGCWYNNIMAERPTWGTLATDDDGNLILVENTNGELVPVPIELPCEDRKARCIVENNIFVLDGYSCEPTPDFVQYAGNGGNVIVGTGCQIGTPGGQKPRPATNLRLS